MRRRCCSTVPNINDVDEALLRPGRCFATVRTRPLERSEAASLLRQLIVDEDRRSALLADLFGRGSNAVSVADIYRAVATL